MLDDIELDAIPSGETRTAILILAGRLQALEDQVKALVTGNVSSEKPEAATSARKPKRPASKTGGST